ncbi:MAG: 7-cyano-7-deazaguanine synthase [Acidobacteria bacterium]|nr:7-cyano-7-deazaguanine synthase [Acidobacteriota bacterium]
MESRPASVVLVSSGLDSAVLLAHEAAQHHVRPIYVRSGLAWEAAELQMLSRLIASPALAGLRSLTVVDLPMRDVYPADHWAIAGTPPAYDTPDADVYLPGRNLALLAKAGLVAARDGARRIALGALAGNPFPDATPAFFAAMGEALSRGLAQALMVVAPFAALTKAQVIELGARLGVPFELTLSCMQPAGDRHCGLCSKCRERRDAFAEAGVFDPTPYANPSPRPPV